MVRVFEDSEDFFLILVQLKTRNNNFEERVYDRAGPRARTKVRYISTAKWVVQVFHPARKIECRKTNGELQIAISFRPLRQLPRTVVDEYFSILTRKVAKWYFPARNKVSRATKRRSQGIETRLQRDGDF